MVTSGEPAPRAGARNSIHTRPANTVAGDYYDVFARPGEGSGNATFLIAIAERVSLRS
jgi:hypothetical protein